MSAPHLVLSGENGLSRCSASAHNHSCMEVAIFPDNIHQPDTALLSSEKEKQEIKERKNMLTSFRLVSVWSRAVAPLNYSCCLCRANRNPLSHPPSTYPPHPILPALTPPSPFTPHSNVHTLTPPSPTLLIPTYPPSSLHPLHSFLPPLHSSSQPTHPPSPHTPHPNLPALTPPSPYTPHPSLPALTPPSPTLLILTCTPSPLPPPTVYTPHPTLYT